MQQNKIINFTQYRTESDELQKRKRTKSHKKGSVYRRGGKLWVDFRYLGERVREPSGLDDTQLGRKTIRNQLDLIVAEIDNGIFEFAKRFPHSKKKDYFTELEGRTVAKDPAEVVFANYVKRWWKEMEPGMSLSMIRDYTSILNVHHIPYFGNMPFDGFTPLQMKKFVATLKGKKNQFDRPLSAKRIQNILIPLRAIVKDAIDEYSWLDFADPFAGLKLPKPKKIAVQPFQFEEWQRLMEFIPTWYRNYFEFAVQTGLRPSEQVALKWTAVDEKFIHIELSRVRNREKEDLKTEDSRRRIEIRPGMRDALLKQWEQTKDLNRPYVFINTFGRPILQDKLREMWARVIKKSGIRYRRMYECRHTFASWALAAGETPEWVARTLGHVDTSMVYKTYGRYIPNLTRRDGSAFEKLYSESTNKSMDTNRHNFGHNGLKSCPWLKLTN
jgi:integrase